MSELCGGTLNSKRGDKQGGREQAREKKGGKRSVKTNHQKEEKRHIMQTKSTPQGRAGTRSSLKCGTGLHCKVSKSLSSQQQQVKSHNDSRHVINNGRSITRTSLRCGTGLHQRRGEGAQQRIVRAETHATLTGWRLKNGSRQNNDAHEGGHRKQKEGQSHRKGCQRRQQNNNKDTRTAIKREKHKKGRETQTHNEKGGKRRGPRRSNGEQIATQEQ